MAPEGCYLLRQDVEPGKDRCDRCTVNLYLDVAAAVIIGVAHWMRADHDTESIDEQYVHISLT
jgi:hypothetical protein